MERAVDVFILNILWVVFSIPVFTIGAATCAAFSVSLKMVDEEEGYVAKQFVKAFKENFKQGTIMWLFTGPGIYLAYLYWQLIIKLDDVSFVVILGAIFYTVILIATNLYTYALIARYENKLVNMVKNSMGICVQFFGRTIFIVVLVAIEVLIILWNKWTMLAGLLIGPEFIIYTISGISKRIFQKLDVNQETGLPVYPKTQEQGSVEKQNKIEESEKTETLENTEAAEQSEVLEQSEEAKKLEKDEVSERNEE